MSDRCGTYAGVNVHHRNREPLCEDCRIAASVYQRQWRGKPGVRDRERQMHYARQRAMARLAREYPARYRELCDEELGR